jgi:hypothetical protein
VRTGRIDFVQGSLPPVGVGVLTVRLRDEAGETLGYLFVYAPSVRPRLLSLIARGDQSMLERMANLSSPVAGAPRSCSPTSSGRPRSPATCRAGRTSS